MFTTDTRLAVITAPLHLAPVSVLNDEHSCKGECGRTVDFTRTYCDWCFDNYCCTTCGVDLDGAEGCAECWEPRWVKPGEDY